MNEFLFGYLIPDALWPGLAVGVGYIGYQLGFADGKRAPK